MCNDRKIRLVYFSLEKYKDHDDYSRLSQGFGMSNTYILPENMSIENACKVISYLSELVEQKHNLEPACPRSISLVDNELENYRFKRVGDGWSGYIHGTCYYTSRAIELSPTLQRAYNQGNRAIDLFTIGGDLKLFKRTNLYNRYFEWFTSGITKDEVRDIYNQIGMNLDAMLKPRQYNWLPKEEYDDRFRLDVNNKYGSPIKEDTLIK